MPFRFHDFALTVDQILDIALTAIVDGVEVTNHVRDTDDTLYTVIAFVKDPADVQYQIFS